MIVQEFRVLGIDNFGIEDNLYTILSRFSHFPIVAFFQATIILFFFLVTNKSDKNFPINLEIGNSFGQDRQDNFDDLSQFLRAERRIVVNCCFSHEHYKNYLPIISLTTETIPLISLLYITL